MGVFFKFPEFTNAVMELGRQSINNGLQLANQNPKSKFPRTQLDNMMGGIEKAYSGNKREQGPLRSLYISFFTQCYGNVQKDKYFYKVIGSAPKFSADMLESLGLNDWEWDFVRPKSTAKSPTQSSSNTTATYVASSTYATSSTSRASKWKTF
ncbi:hypothetical protein PG987_006545 [Apiospora arundinis]